jgi:inhibitor of KinA
MTLHPMGDAAVVLDLGQAIDEATLARVGSVARAIGGRPPAGVTDIVPAFGSVTVFYDPRKVSSYADLASALIKLAAPAEQTFSAEPARLVEIPVCYGGEFGPDLEVVANHAGLTPGEVITLHSGAEYRVHAIGFSPGFPYLGGLPPRLNTPRRATPRTVVPAGSVGIGSAQTGVYPVATPGGWNLIGRSPRALFRLHQSPPALLFTGDRVKFRPITPEEFAAWK